MGRIDRRNSKRITYICEVECETAGAHRITTRINDISLTGMFIDSMTSFAVGAVLKLKFRVKDQIDRGAGRSPVFDAAGGHGRALHQPQCRTDGRA